MIKYKDDIALKLKEEWKECIDPRLRNIILGLEFFVYNDLGRRKSADIVITRIHDADASNGESKHRLNPALAIDIENVFDDIEIERIRDHLMHCGALPTSLKRGEELHIEISVPGLKVRINECQNTAQVEKRDSGQSITY